MDVGSIWMFQTRFDLPDTAVLCLASQLHLFFNMYMVEVIYHRVFSRLTLTPLIISSFFEEYSPNNGSTHPLPVTALAVSTTPIERKICRFLKLMNSVLKAQLSSLLGHLFRIRGFLISPPSPLRWGKAST